MAFSAQPYIELLEEFVRNRLPPAQFREAYIAKWILDVDAEATAWKNQRDKGTASGDRKSANLLACGTGDSSSAADRDSGVTERRDASYQLIDAMHSTVYHFTSDAEDITDDPEFFVGEAELRAEAQAALNSLKELLGDDLQSNH